jgi:hypothetical protein
VSKCGADDRPVNGLTNRPDRSWAANIRLTPVSDHEDLVQSRDHPDERDDESLLEGREVTAFPSGRLRHFQKQGSVEEK